VLTYLFGPFLTLLPQRWRKSLSFSGAVNWRRATVLSAFLEAAVALTGIMFWYSYYMQLLVDRGLGAAITGKVPNVTDHDIGFTALVIWATHPLTWLLAFAGIEGAVRLVSAAFTESNYGIFPLFVVDKVFGAITGRNKREAAAEGQFGLKENFHSYIGAIRERAVIQRTEIVPDELCFTGNAPDEMLEIRACRRKQDWNPPRTVRYLEDFYRLEAFSNGAHPRPFRYTLRKLSAGVMGRTVLVYSPDEAPVLAKR
jgi:hypothetical protein